MNTALDTVKLVELAKKFRDGFKPNPGTSDLDREQPICVWVSLGDWRDLDWLLRQAEGATSFAAKFRTKDLKPKKPKTIIE